jgi:FkbM family methyltransferase
VIQRFIKPWFVYQPAQLLKRAAASLRPPLPGYRPLATSWGASIVADPARTIGHSIATTGVYDIALSEALARLIAPGDTIVDAGANVGYATLLASLAAGPAGKVVAFEPHPTLFPILEGNVERARQRYVIAAVDLRQSALSDAPGTAILEVPDGFAANDGVSRLATASTGADTSPVVRVETLDDVLNGTAVTVLKLDVEGFERAVLRGAARTLREHRIRHIIFEDHQPQPSDVVRDLQGTGYQVLSLGWSIRGPVVRPVEAATLAKAYEAPNFIATARPDDVIAACAARGWRVLNRELAGSRRSGATPIRGG